MRESLHRAGLALRHLGLVALVASFTGCAPGCSTWAGATKCYLDGGIEASRRTGIEAAASNFLRTALDGDPRDAYPMLSEDLQAKVSRKEFGKILDEMKALHPAGVTVQNTYFLKSTGNPSPRTICAENLKDPTTVRTLSAVNVPEQAHVLLGARTQNNDWTFAVWLVPEAGTWKVRTFWMNVSGLSGRDAEVLWKMGIRQAEKGHRFNAGALYSTAAMYANRGPDFRLGLVDAIAESNARNQVPPEVAGKPPFRWSDGDATFEVKGISLLGVGGKIYVQLTHDVPEGQTEGTFEARNRELLGRFKKLFPEYADVFAGVVVRGFEVGTDRVFGTVEEDPPTR